MGMLLGLGIHPNGEPVVTNKLSLDRDGSHSFDNIRVLQTSALALHLLFYDEIYILNKLVTEIKQFLILMTNVTMQQERFQNKKLKNLNNYIFVCTEKTN